MRPPINTLPGDLIDQSRQGVSEMKKAKGLLIAAACSAVACIFQIVGLVRYLGRLPDDRLGIGLYAVTIVAFALGTIGFYVQSRKRPS